MEIKMRYLIAIVLALLLPVSAMAGSQQVRTVVGMAKAAGGSGPLIEDDFSSDTSADYTAITGTINIASGTVGGGTNWANNFFYHETATGSNNHYIEADITPGPYYHTGNSIVVRCNGSTGYIFYLEATNNRISVSRFSGATVTGIENKTISYDILDTQKYRTRVEISGSTISLFIDTNGDNDFGDANETIGTSSDSTYSTGQYVGIGAERGGDGVDYRADNLEGDAL